MDTRRARFFAALGLFLVWVAGLATLAVVSGRRPVAKPPLSAGLPTSAAPTDLDQAGPK